MTPNGIGVPSSSSQGGTIQLSWDAVRVEESGDTMQATHEYNGDAVMFRDDSLKSPAFEANHRRRDMAFKTRHESNYDGTLNLPFEGASPFV